MLKNDKMNFIIALIIAAGLWAYVFVTDNQHMDTTIKNVPITIVNEASLEEDGLVLLSVSDETVNVKVRGERGQAGKIKKEGIRVVLDLEGVKKGERTVSLQITVPDRIEFKDASKRKVNVVIDELVTEEKKIQTFIDGDTDDEREPYIVQTDFDTVNVTGAKTLVDSIAYVSAPLDVKLVGDELHAISVGLVPVDKNNEPIDHVKLAKKNVSVTTVMLNKKTVPLQVLVIGADAADADRTVTVPKTITIKGYASALADISYIGADPIDVSDIYEDSILPVNPQLPEGIEIAANSQNLTAKVAVRGMETRTFRFGKESIAVEGITEDQIASIEDVDITLTAVGKEEIISGLSENDFYFAADAEKLKPGKHRLTLRCRYTVQLSEVEFQPKTVVVIIESAEDSDSEPDTDGNSDSDAVEGSEE